MYTLQGLGPCVWKGSHYILKNHNPPIPLAKVDCTTEYGERIYDSNEVNAVPTLKVFKQGNSTEYDGPKNSDAIVNYMRSEVAWSIFWN